MNTSSPYRTAMPPTTVPSSMIHRYAHRYSESTFPAPHSSELNRSNPLVKPVVETTSSEGRRPKPSSCRPAPHSKCASIHAAWRPSAGLMRRGMFHFIAGHMTTLDRRFLDLNPSCHQKGAPPNPGRFRARWPDALTGDACDCLIGRRPSAPASETLIAAVLPRLRTGTGMFQDRSGGQSTHGRHRRCHMRGRILAMAEARSGFTGAFPTIANRPTTKE
jgi:hypothetical protein